jgi:hypothetical protein
MLSKATDVVKMPLSDCGHTASIDSKLLIAELLIAECQSIISLDLVLECTYAPMNRGKGN